MKYILLIAPLLLMTTGPVYADWVLIGNSEVGVQYIDPQTIRRKGDLVKVWALYDYKTAQASPAGKRYSSIRAQVEVHCSEERIRFLAMTSFSGNMERGETVYADSVKQEWQPVAPRSLAQTMWNLVCRKE